MALGDPLRRCLQCISETFVRFDPQSIGSKNRGERRYDLPGGAKRMVMPSKGVEHTLVNGEVVYEDGKLTGAAPGEVLRS